jgi:hypothetical protein
MGSRSAFQGKYLNLNREENGETYVMRCLVVIIFLIERYKLSTLSVSPGFI